MIPKRRIRLGDHFGMGYPQSFMTKSGRCESHSHAMVLVSGYRLHRGSATFSVPTQRIAMLVINDETQFAALLLERFYTVGLLYLQGLQSRETESSRFAIP